MRRLEAGTQHLVRCSVNGQPVEGRVEPRTLATDFLRHTLGFTGTNVGCEHGVCGACTIRIEGRAARACLTFAVQLDGQSVATVEGLTDETGALDDLQQAFRRHHALQCGYCTPGILMSLSQLVDEEPDADEPRVREVLSGHICRCTGYQGIVMAALDVLAERRALSKGED